MKSVLIIKPNDPVGDEIMSEILLMCEIFSRTDVAIVCREFATTHSKIRSLQREKIITERKLSQLTGPPYCEGSITA